MKGILAPAYELSLALLPAFNGQVLHNFQNNYYGGSVKIMASNDNFELPSTIPYKNGDKYYNGVYNTDTEKITTSATARGAAAYFGYTYDIQKTGGLLTASAIAQYEVRIFNDPISGVPLIFAANTGKASVDFTVSYN
ncbi:hypothetical protein [Paenibacillus sp. DCT19]|uniref:hypothetical protein n=1 Tax=Paenibacillus sp. DCT19 TaxID=2211212 RepID=UPI000FE20485|nr:hypothetical protein [Paenibacillus sp. DCT19]